MARDFYPFVEGSSAGDGHDETPKTSTDGPSLEVKYPARIAVYDDASAAPRVVVVEPKDVRSYLEEITTTVVRLAKEQGSTIPFMVIREIVENFIHAYFIEPTISILDGGETIRFSDQGPGIKSKELALEYGTTSASEEMKQYIRGVGSGLPYVQQYMEDRGGTLTIDDNISGGTVVTISNVQEEEEEPLPPQLAPQGQPYAMPPQQAAAAPGYPQAGSPVPGYGMPAYGQTPYPAQPYGAGTQGFAQAPYQPYQPYPPQYAQYPQTSPYPGYAPAQGQAAAPQPQMAAAPTLSERGRTVLGYLLMNQAVGPTDLTRQFGSSQPTWTRELQRLEKAGFVRKNKGAQKYVLTDLGRSYAQQAGGQPGVQ
ncbi:MAG: ATP-binding protein [Parafannyhessea sp.]|uniref:ATP-binding protein n=1 Tax=Parafannyhessea sp. TaxID=2847324 RepID=UPI003F10E4F1